MISILEIRPPDRDALIRLCKQQKNFNAQEIEVAIEVIDDALNPAKNDYQVLKAQTAQGQVVGFICYGAIPLTDNRFDLYWIAVNPQYGRLGIGNLLLTAMAQRLKAFAPAYIYVDTSSTQGYDAARAFYEKNDYELVATLTHFYRDNDHKLIYRKRI